MKIGLIGILIVGAIIIGGYFLFHGTESPTQTPTPSASRSVTPTRTPTPTGVGATPTSTPTATPTPIPSFSLSPTPTSSASLSPTPTSTPTATPTPIPTPQTYSVLLQNHQFNPSALTVPKGSDVVFTAIDAFYSVTVGSARSSGRMQPGQQWTLHSDDFLPGEYRMTESTYASMRGTLTIQ